MGIQSEVMAKQKTASPTAQGSSMEKVTPKVVSSSPSLSNEQQPVTRNQSFAQKGLSFKKVQTGY